MPLQPPPEVKRPTSGSFLAKILPVVTIAGAAGMVAMLFASGSLASNPVGLLFPVMMAVSTLGMYAGQRSGTSAGASDADRADYLRYLDQTRAEVAAVRSDQQAAAAWTHPDPRMLWERAGTSRMWERRSTDPDFGHVRIGVGDQRLARGLVTPDLGPLDELEPVSALALRRFVRAHSVVPNLPIAVSLRGYASVRIEGDADIVRAGVRALVSSLCMAHGPDDVVVAIVADPTVAGRWDWAKWLPHVQHPTQRDALGERRLVGVSVSDVRAMLGGWLSNRGRFTRSASTHTAPHVVVIADSVDASEVIGDAGLESVTLVSFGTPLAPAVGRTLELSLDGRQISARGESGLTPIAVIDEVSIVEAEQVARSMARFRAPALGSTPAEGTRSRSGWAGLIDIDPLNFDADQSWSRRVGRDRLRVPVGVAEDGSVVELDLKESAESGIGPHGLCIGATGSGKSEFLRTLVLGLIATHSPEQLNLVLVDFKGGATFLGLDGVHHVAAVITNLEAESTLVERMRDALAGEMNRRQEILRAAGNFANVGDYERAREAGAQLAPMPALLIVVDEFSELLSQHPEFSELFVAIGRLGRSLHIHLLLSSQRLDEGRLRGVDSHLSYRIGLKTFSASESRAVLGVPDAHHLPSTPGAAYLKSDHGDLLRFQSAYVSGPFVESAAGGARVRSSALRPMLFRALEVEMPDVPPAIAQAAADAGTSTLFDTIVGKVRGRGANAHRVWLPPLDASADLTEILGARLEAEIEALAGLRVPIGQVDRPFEQRRDPLVVDFSGGFGNAAIVGGPQSGKSTAIRTLVCSLALTHSSRQVQFYCLDFGGGLLNGLTQLPHVGSVASRRDSDLVRRTVAEVTGLVAERERHFRTWGVESMVEFRRRRATEPSFGDDFGDVFLVIDGFGVLRSDFDGLEQQITAIATQGLSYGVHVVITAARWPDLRPALKDQLGTRIELRLGDAIDSDFGRRLAAQVPAGRPGRGMTKEGHHLLVARPQIGDQAGLFAVANLVAVRNASDPAPAVRMLPTELRVDALHAALVDASMGKLAVPIGLREADLRPAFVDFAEQAHMLVFGDSECGKTNLLRLIARELTERHAPSEVKLIVGDYRRTLLGVVDGDHLAGYAPAAPTLTTMMNDLSTVLRGRLPAADITQQQLRDRSWWSGPEIFVIIDDYDLVATGSNPMAPIVEFLAQAKDIGLHLVLARRSGGAARALFDPVISRLREVGAAGVVMSGNREEGALVGQVRPSAMPAGRGVFVTRDAALVQTAWAPPS
ncbi:type VII secretion protein EccC [Smaragdicoccus niigatensis]